jgi:lactosylceramide 4-alpha-galactosyltransferase
MTHRPIKKVLIASVIFLGIYGFFSLTDLKEEIILDAKVQPRNGQNIFFVETSENTTNVKLSARQACSIESAALKNPHLNVFVFYYSKLRLKALEKTPEVDAILSYPNVVISFLNFSKISTGSPMEEFMHSEKLSNSKFRIEHTSDALRLLVLWKFGGTYLDTDMIVRKRLDSVQPNFACQQSQTEINGAILNFEKSEIGTKLIGTFMKDFVTNFNGNFFVSNGPYALTRVLKSLCNANDMEAIMKIENCQGFSVYNISMCYEITFSEMYKLMEPFYQEETLRRVNESLVVHFWNKESKKRVLEKNSGAAYVELAKQFCPRVFQSIEGKYF